jgi:hypothetical protein
VISDKSSDEASIIDVKKESADFVKPKKGAKITFNQEMRYAERQEGVDFFTKSNKQTPKTQHSRKRRKHENSLKSSPNVHNYSSSKNNKSQSEFLKFKEMKESLLNPP